MYKVNRQLITLGDTNSMSPWDVIEGALARKKPARDQAWLAAQLQISPQAVSNWKDRKVPPSKYEALSELLGLSMEQLAGRVPAPWETPQGEWPFPDIEVSRWVRLSDPQRWEIQLRVRELVEKFEHDKISSGKLPSSQGNAGRSRSA